MLIHHLLMCAYLGAFCYGLFVYYRPRFLTLLSWVTAVILFWHGLLLYTVIDTAYGHNLSMGHMVSLFCWLVTIMAILTKWLIVKNSPIFLLPLPLCALSLLTLDYFPVTPYLTHIEPLKLLHIFLAILSLSTLLTGGLHSFVVYAQKNLLKTKEGFRLLRALPALETNERLHGQLIAVGFMLLTAMLLTALSLMAVTHKIIAKTILTVLGWAFFALLLYGRWRSMTKIYWTLAGSLCLAIAYFGTKLL